MNLSAFIKTQNLILLDGAMGTELANRNLTMGGQQCLLHPDDVFEIHKEYVRSGCHLITTNTLTMNRIYIETHKLDISISEVNKAGVEIAKKAINANQYILGNISSTGKILEPFGDLSESAAYKTFKEQAEYLLDGGVDGFLIETMISLKEMLCAVKACKDSSSVPVFASMCFATLNNGGCTIMGDTAKQCAEDLAAAGADVIGLNCGDLDPVQMAEIIKIYNNTTKLPILVQPNAGKPELVDGKTVYRMTPDDFKKGIFQCIHAGACLVGGCCGTTPIHIQAISSFPANQTISKE